MLQTVKTILVQRHLVETLCYKPEGRGFDPDGVMVIGIVIDVILPAAIWPWG